MDWVLALLLFLHIGGAILAFGPTYAFMILGPMVGREPMHGNFALRFQKRVSSVLIAPLALLQGVTGLLVVWRAQWDILATGWLLVGIALYLVLLGIGFGVLIPTLGRLLEATASPPPAPAPGTPPPTGPPPHVQALVSRARLAGSVNAALILIIVFLMVAKPF